MGIWFVRSNGETLHNDPNLPTFVPGEPPTFPKRSFRYREECLRDGFVRVGWPAAGDLRQPGWEARADHIYSPSMQPHHRSYLQQFSTIRTGDIVLMPSEQHPYLVHIGAVVIRDTRTRQVTTVHPGLPAYRYHFDVGHGDWFENAHRVDVLWDADAEGRAEAHDLPMLRGLWRRAFAPVRQGASDVATLARGLGLPTT
ncbi:MAG: hypothetical protein JWM27_3051 [Gemmatimonadetes bacterium]|nr:hypothetical protein [Gemmatimonadota bacterium]